MTPTVRPRTPAELAVLLPYQLGYHPGPSVVMTALHERRLGLVQRHDLLDDPEDCADAARRAVAICAREEATAVVVIAHEEEAGESDPLRRAMLEAAGAEGLRVQEHIVVRRGRWYAPGCDEPCCPDAGLPLPPPEDVPAVAAFVHAGVAPLPSRSALVDGVLPAREEERARAVGLHLEAIGRGGATRVFGGGPTRASSAWTDRLEEVLDWWTALLDPQESASPVADLPDEALAWTAASLQHQGWRDALMAVLCPGTLPTAASASPAVPPARYAASRCPWVPLDLDPHGEERVTHEVAPSPAAWHDEVLAVRSRLVDLVRLLPREATPPVLVLVAHLAWWGGDGTVAAVCLERALEVDPDHRLAGLMLRLLSMGVRLSAVSGTDVGAAVDGTPGEAA